MKRGCQLDMAHQLETESHISLEKWETGLVVAGEKSEKRDLQNTGVTKWLKMDVKLIYASYSF